MPRAYHSGAGSNGEPEKSERSEKSEKSECWNGRVTTSQELHKLSETWSFAVGDGTKDGFPLVAASTGFERLTMYPRTAMLGRRCGDVLGAKEVNPEWLLEHLRTAVRAVASGDATWADFLVMNRRGDMSCFPNYVRLVMLNALCGSSNPATKRMILALQVDASDMVQLQFQVEGKYHEKLQQVRAAMPWPEDLGKPETAAELESFVRASLPDCPPARPPPPARTPPGVADDVTTVTSAMTATSAPSVCSANTWPRPSGRHAQTDSSNRSESLTRSLPAAHQHWLTPEPRDSPDGKRPVYVMTYRHTTGSFKAELLNSVALQRCVHPLSLPHGPLVLAEDQATHRALCGLAKDFHPRHVLVEAKVMPALAAAAERIKGSRGRKVNEKSRQIVDVWIDQDPPSGPSRDCRFADRFF